MWGEVGLRRGPRFARLVLFEEAGLKTLARIEMATAETVTIRFPWSRQQLREKQTFDRGQIPKNSANRREYLSVMRGLSHIGVASAARYVARML